MDSMGIYFRSGIEFGISYLDGHYEVIYDTATFDERLVASHYYKQGTCTVRHRQSRQIIEATDIDIHLTEGEKQHIDSYISGKTGIKEYGFYDVCCLGTSYE